MGRPGGENRAIGKFELSATRAIIAHLVAGNGIVFRVAHRKQTADQNGRRFQKRVGTVHLGHTWPMIDDVTDGVSCVVGSKIHIFNFDECVRAVAAADIVNDAVGRPRHPGDDIVRPCAGHPRNVCSTISVEDVIACITGERIVHAVAGKRIGPGPADGRLDIGVDAGGIVVAHDRNVIGVAADRAEPAGAQINDGPAGIS